MNASLIDQYREGTRPRRGRRAVPRKLSAAGGAVGFALLAAACVLRSAPAIEAAVLSSVEKTFDQQSPELAGRVALSVDGRDITIGGVASSTSERLLATALAQRSNGVRRVVNEMTVGASASMRVITADAADAGIKADATTAAAEKTVSEASDDTADADTADTADAADAADADTAPVASNTAPAANDTETPRAADDASATQTATTAKGDNAAMPALDSVTVDANTPRVAETTRPQLRISFDSNALNIDGLLASDDELNALANAGMRSGGVHYLSSQVIVNDSNAEAPWLDELAPVLEQLDDIVRMQLLVVDNALKVSGAARDQDAAMRFMNALDDIPGLDVSGSMGVDDAVAPAATPTGAAASNTARDALTASDSAAVSDATTHAPVTGPTPMAPIARQRPTISSHSAPYEGAEAAEADAMRSAFAALEDTRIQFASGNTVLVGNSQANIDAIADVLRNFPMVAVRIGGHTDNSGDSEANLVLSQERANVVRDELVRRGISPYRLSSSGYGESLPVASNDTEAGKQANRRIEFIF